MKPAARYVPAAVLVLLVGLGLLSVLEFDAAERVPASDSPPRVSDGDGTASPAGDASPQVEETRAPLAVTTPEGAPSEVASCTGRVQDPLGVPVSALALSVRYHDRIVEVTSDALGRLALPASDGIDVRFVAADPSWTVVDVDGRGARAPIGPDFTLTVSRNGVIEVTATLADAPLAEFEASARATSGEAHSARAPARNGMASLAVPPGSYFVWVAPVGGLQVGVETAASTPVVASVGPGRTFRIEARLAEKFELTLRLLDAAGGAPVAGATVRLVDDPAGGPDERSITSDARGEAKLVGVRAQVASAVAGGGASTSAEPRFCRVEHPDYPTAFLPIDCGPRAKPVQEWRLEKPVTAARIVVVGWRDRVLGARVVLEPVSEALSTLGSGSSFALQGDDPAVGPVGIGLYRASIVEPGGLRLWEGQLGIGPGMREVKIDLGAGPSVALRVEGWLPRDDRLEGVIQLQRQAGRFSVRISASPTQRAQIALPLPGSCTMTGRFGDASILWPSPLGLGNGELVLSLAGADVTLELLAAEGQPLARGRVLVQRVDGTGSLRAEADDAGRVRMRNLPQGFYEVRRLDLAATTQRGVLGFQVGADSTGADVVLRFDLRERTGAIEGELRTQSREVFAAWLTALDRETIDALGGTNVLFAWVDHAGRFGFESLPSGQYRVELRKLMPDGSTTPCSGCDPKLLQVGTTVSTVVLTMPN